MLKLICELLNWSKILWLNFGIENRYSAHGSFPWIRKKTINDGNGLDQLCLLTGQQQDYVFTRNKIPEFVLEGYVKAGFSLPQIHLLNSCDSAAYTTDLVAGAYFSQIKSLSGYRLVPFGITQAEANFAADTGLELFGLDADSAASLNSKIRLRSYAEANRIRCPFGCIAETYQEADRFVNRYITKFPLIVKTEYGSSGTGIFIVLNAQDWCFLYKRLQKLSYTMPLLIERYYQRKDSFNYQLLAVNNQAQLISIKKQQINRSMSYTGCDWMNHIPKLGNEEFLLATECMKSLLLQQSGNALINIDGITDEYGVLYPVIDLNARLSLTSYFTLSETIQRSPYQNFRFRIYPCQSVQPKQIEALTSKYLFGRCREAIMVCCYQAQREHSIGRLGVLYAADYVTNLDSLEQKLLALVV